MELLDGKKAKEILLKNLREKLSQFNCKLGLAVIQIGNDPASNIYLKNKLNMANSLGYYFNHIHLNEDVKEEKILAIINELNCNDNIDGILVQMPIPSSLNAKKIQNAIDPNKDVDGLTDINMGKLAHNVESIIPCTPIGILDLLKIYNISVEGKNVVIVGRSDLVGKPLANLMINNNATVSLGHSKTNNLKDLTKMADILIVAVGKPKFITRDMVKHNSIIIDVGINRSDKGIIGDVDYDNVKDIVSYITPVPGGVGQMTVAELGLNTYKAHILRKKYN